MTKKQSIKKQPSKVEYLVYPFQLNSHCYTVQCKIYRPNPSGQRLSLPAWIPGSYKIRDFAKHIIEISAKANEKHILIEKIDKQTWQVAPTRHTLEITYRVYARDPGVRGAWLDMNRGFFNGTQLFLRVEGQADSFHQVDIFRPVEDHTQQWGLATALPRLEALPNGFGRYLAKNYEELIDSPVAFGLLQYGFFEANGVAHTIAITGAHEPVQMEVLTRDCQRLCETHLDFFDRPYPIKNYLFLINVAAEGISGLEHNHCCALQCTRENLPIMNRKVPRRYPALLRLISHEYFHLWWVKRVKPSAFALSDLSQEAYSRQLWIFEGMTAYYEDVLLLRSGLMPEQEFLGLLASNIQSVMLSAGANIQSTAESSFDAWIKFYQLEEASPHAVTNYYIKGAVIALCLDLTIRLKTKGKQSLDTIIQSIWQHVKSTGAFLEEGEFENIAENITGLKLKTLLKKWVYGTEPLPWEELLQKFQVTAERSYHSTPYLGMLLAEEGLLSKIIKIEDQGAAQRAGLLTGDLIISFNRMNLTGRKLDLFLETFVPAMAIEITFLRDGLLGQTHLRLDPPALDHLSLKVSKQKRQPLSQALRESWLASSEKKLFFYAT